MFVGVVALSGGLLAASPTVQRPPLIGWRVVGVQHRFVRPADGADHEADRPAHLYVWPEGAAQLFTSEDLAGVFAGLSPGAVRITGLIHPGQRRRRNAVGVADGSRRILGVSFKRLLVPIIEGRHFEAGEGLTGAQRVRGRAVALPICYEILDRPGLAREHGELIVNVASDLFDPTRTAAVLMARSAWLRALEFGVPVIRVSNVAHSIAISPHGEILAHAAAGPAILEVVVGLSGRNEAHFFVPGSTLAALLLLAALASISPSRSPHAGTRSDRGPHRRCGEVVGPGRTWRVSSPSM